MGKAASAKRSRKQLLDQMETERREWLEAGMSEADIYRIHFGEEDEDGRGGDYRVWLSYQAIADAKRKYAPGAPLSLDAFKYEGALFIDPKSEDELTNTEQTADIETALSALPPGQAKLARALIFEGITPAEYARRNGISKAAASKTLGKLQKKLESFTGGLTNRPSQPLVF
jgi:RNA polymerase sigma factor (sigma-70 family)